MSISGRRRKGKYADRRQNWGSQSPGLGPDTLGPDESKRMRIADVDTNFSAKLQQCAVDAIRARIKRLGLRRRWP